MINVIWLFLVVAGVLVAGATGRVDLITSSITDQAGTATNLILGLAGIMVFWMGMMNIAAKSGLMQVFARLLRPLVMRLFPDVPPDHPAAGAILMNVSANFLGLGNAATPLGLNAMQELQKLNDDPETASPAMCTFLALNTAAVTLVPATVVALRAAAGSASPADIVGPTFVATLAAATMAISLDRVFRRGLRPRKGGRRP
ncbi:MAG: nucleoside recognition domain-containing protein [Symbiobacteriia bacterium]